MAAIQTKGVCRLCGGTFGKKAISTHLKECSERSAIQSKTKRVPVFHIEIDGGRYLPMFWLHVLARSTAELRHLDSFLREIWLECCGHMSQFLIDGQEFIISPEGSRERGMDVKLEKILKGDSTFAHDYDFGSTTELRLHVVNALEYPMKTRSNVVLVARNDAPNLPCSVCSEPATEICSYCLCEGEGPLCSRCAESHECDEEGLLPVVNSPRCGVCAYAGSVEEETARA